MKKKIIFVTTNTGKFEEIARWAKQLDPNLEFEQAEIDLPEIQSLDVKEVAQYKAQQAWELLKQPLLVDDGGLFIEQYHLFPGVFSKYIYHQIGLDAIWKLAQEDPRAYFLSCLVYIDSQNSFYFFESKCHGKLIAPGHEITHKQLPYSSIFIPTGSNKPFSALRDTEEEKLYHHRFNALKNLVNWFNS